MASPKTASGRHVTYAEYCAWPDDGKRYEIIDGVVFEMNAPLLPHQEVAAQLWRRIDDWMEGRGAGRAWIAPVDVVFADESVVQPDVVVVSTERRSIVRTQAIFGAPDFVIEVLSPSSTPHDTLRKPALYQKHGVREYWIVDTAGRCVWQFALENGVLGEVAEFAADAEVESRAFPGLKIRLAEIWRKPFAS